MIANSIFAAGAFVSLVAAIPLAQPPFAKRDVVWETHTEVALTTIPVTVTHWLEPGETPPTVDTAGKHYGHHGGHHGGQGQPPAQPETTQTAAPAPPASSPEIAPQAPAPSSYEQPTQQAPAPAPTTAAAAPPAYTPQPQPQPQPSPEPAPAPEEPSSGGSNGLTGIAAAGKSYTGDLTYYDPGLGACGKTHGPDDAIVAISEAIFDAYDNGNPNNNPLCGLFVTIIGEDGSPYKAEIVDRCPGCTQGDLDLAPTFFESVVPHGNGRVPGMKWSFD